MAMHTMTPARRAALRKAQLASAAKRRKYGVGSAIKRSGRQGFQRAHANTQLAIANKTSPAARRSYKQRAAPHAKKAAKIVAGAALVGAAGAGLAVAAGHRQINNKVASQGYYHSSRTGRTFTANKSKIGRAVGTGKKARIQGAMRNHPANISKTAIHGVKHPGTTNPARRGLSSYRAQSHADKFALAAYQTDKTRLRPVK